MMADASSNYTHKHVFTTYVSEFLGRIPTEMFPAVLRAMLVTDGLDVENQVTLEEAASWIESTQEEYDEMKAEWEGFAKNARILENEEGNGLEILDDGWMHITMAWDDLTDTLDTIRKGNQFAAFGWKKKVELWENGIVDGCHEMSEIWGDIECRGNWIESNDCVDKVIDNVIEIKNITACAQQWRAKISDLRSTREEWNTAIEQMMGAK